jgi:hypothetical protein
MKKPLAIETGKGCKGWFQPKLELVDQIQSQRKRILLRIAK